MLIDLKTKLAGPLGSFMPGRHEMPDDRALELVARGFANHIGPPPAPEPAAEPPTPEMEMQPEPPLRKRRSRKPKTED